MAGFNKYMIKLPIILIISAFIFIIAGTNPHSLIYAQSETAEASAVLATKPGEVMPDQRIRDLKNYLRYHNSPLEDYSSDFVWLADKYNIDWKLVPAITGVESTFGKFIPQGSYNAYGWANGNYYFSSWPESIEIVSKTLREKYFDRGADTVEEIAPIYAPPSNTWAGKVQYFMAEIENFDTKSNESPLLTLSL